MYQFERVQTDLESLNQISALLGATFPNSSPLFTVEYLNWLYTKNPHGQVIGYNALVPGSGDLAAHYVIIPRKMIVHGVKVLTALSLNTATHPAHQGKKLFTQLAEKTFEVARAENVTQVFGVANQNSVHGFVKKLGFYCMGQLEARIYAGCPDAILGNKGLSHELERDFAWLQWRLGKPGRHYHIASHANHVNVSTSAKLGIRAILSNSIAPGHVLKATDVLPTGPFWLWLGSHSQAGRWNIPVPKALRPSPLNLIQLDLQGSSKLGMDELFFETIDFDAY